MLFFNDKSFFCTLCMQDLGISVFDVAILPKFDRILAEILRPGYSDRLLWHFFVLKFI